MHEVSLLAGLLDQVTEAARAKAFHQVKEIRLSVGAASGVDPDSLEFCFPHVMQGTLLENAKLIIERRPLSLVCQTCGKHTESDEILALVCPHCTALDVVVTGGKDFLILDLSVV